MAQGDLFEDLKDKVEDKLKDIKEEVQEDAESLWDKPVFKFMVMAFGVIVLCMVALTLVG